VLVFRNDTKITKSEFAKFFVTQLDLEMSDKDKNEDSIFVDITTTDENYKEIKAIYDLGLLDTEAHNFFPEHYLTRGEAIQIIFDYFDEDLTTSEKIDFNDVNFNAPIYYYVATLLENDENEIFSTHANIEEPATTHFVNYLINEYPQNN